MSSEDKDFLFRLSVSIGTGVLVALIAMALIRCTVSYKTHNTGQKYKHFEIRIFQKRDTIPFDTVKVHPIKIEH